MMKRFIRQKNRNNRSMGPVLLISVLILSVVYAALYSVVYMQGSGSVEISYNNLYYYVDKDTEEGKFYTSCKNTEGEHSSPVVSSPTGIENISGAVSALNEGGTIYMLSEYKVTGNEVVTLKNKTVQIQRYTIESEGKNYSSHIGSLFYVDGEGTSLTFELVKGDSSNAPCLTINGNEAKSAVSAFKVLNSGTLTLNNVDGEGNVQGMFTVTGNYSSSYGGAINVSGGLVNATAVKFENNYSIISGSSLAYGGAIYAGGESTLELNKCSFEGNTARSTSSGYVSGANMCTRGSSPAFGGAVCSIKSTVNMSSCTFTSNAADVENNNTTEAEGGAVYIGEGSSGVMENCTVTGNQTSSSTRGGAGVCVRAGENKFKIIGKTTISGNSCYYLDEKNSSGLNVNDNLYLCGTENGNISINTSKVASGSQIFLSTNPAPSENENLKALISDKDNKTSLKDCFKSDLGGYTVSNETDGLYLISAPAYDNLWYGEKTVAGYDSYGEIGEKEYKYKGFFYDEGLENDTGFTRLVDAVCAVKSADGSNSSTGNIHMLTNYELSGNEIVNIPAGKNVNVVRAGTFNNNSMFVIDKGTNLTINAPNTDSSITFDGNNVTLDGECDGGAFHVGDGNLTLSGAEKTDKSKTIVIKNNIVSSSNFMCGGAVYISKGTNTLSNCSITGNTVSSSSSAYGGAVYISNGTNTLSDCSITGNTASSSYSSSYAKGGGVYISGGNTKLLGMMNITGNKLKNDNSNDVDSNLHLAYTVVDLDKSLDTNSKIGLTTSSDPSQSDVKFAKNALGSMKKCFSLDDSSSECVIKLKDYDLYIGTKGYDELWYKAYDDGDEKVEGKEKEFFEGSVADNLSTTGITTFEGAISALKKDGKIHMLSQYASAADEAVAVPQETNITVIRESTFTTDSMFKITGGTFTLTSSFVSSTITFDGNKANMPSGTVTYNGGAFCVDGGNLILKGNNVESDSMNPDEEEIGGVKVNVKNIIIKNNKASSGGGVYINNSNESKLSNCKMIGNSGTWGGGVCFDGSGSPTLKDCNLTGNSSAGVCIHGSGEPTLENCNIIGNRGNWGGGVCIGDRSNASSGNSTLKNCNIIGNTGRHGCGVCIYSSGTNTFTSCDISGNEVYDGGDNAFLGGGVCITGTGGTNTFTGCSISNNKSSAEGGGFYIDKGTTTLENCDIIGNTSSSSHRNWGGGIYTFGGAITLTNCNLKGNSAHVGGGALFEQGSQTLKGCTIADNTASDNGGGARINGSQATVLEGCTITGNTAGKGGGLYIDYGANILKNCTITGNTASSSGGGVYIGDDDSDTNNINRLFGKMIITGNTAGVESESSANNMYFKSGKFVYLEYINDKLSDGSQIGVTTETEPTGGDVLFAKRVTESYMASCFTSDKGYLIYKNPYIYGELYVSLGGNITDIYQMNNKFYLDAIGEKPTNIKTMAEAVKLASNIHMLTAYEVSSNETLDIPSGKEVNIIRDKPSSSLNLGSDEVTKNPMFKITGGEFLVNATDPTSSIIFDGKEIETSATQGGAFYVNGGSIKLNGAEKTDEEKSKTITIKGNVISSTESSVYGGAIYITGDGINTLSNCSIINNKINAVNVSSSQVNSLGGAVYINGGTSTLSNCNITGNTASVSNSQGYMLFAQGGGVYIAGKGTNTLENCNISGNTSNAESKFSSPDPDIIFVHSDSGGLCINGSGTNTLTGCTIDSNTSAATSASTDAYPSSGGVYIAGGGTNTFENCSITNNKAYYVGGILISGGGKNTFLGTMNITGNTATSGSINNASFSSANPVILDDENGKTLSTDSQIHMMTDRTPTVGEPITFATKATESMKGCFKPENDEYEVILNGKDLQLKAADYDHLWYQVDTSDNTKKFFSGSDTEPLKSTGLTKLSDAVSILKSKGTIHMLTSYEKSESESIDIGSRNITVIREKGFTTDSMFKITGGNFTINATDQGSSITFDGNNVGITEIINGGAFNISGDTTQLTLKGAEGKKNIIITKNVLAKINVNGSDVESIGGCGGGICIQSSTKKQTITNCDFNNNKAIYLGGGFMNYVSGGNLEVTNCSFTGNVVSGAGPGIGGGLLASGATNEGVHIISNCEFMNNESEFAGGGIGLGGGINTISNCSLTGNKSHVGGGISFEAVGSTNTVSNCKITGNNASNSHGGIYHSGGNVNLFGTIIVTDNTANGSKDNYCFASDDGFVTLSDDSGNKLSTDSKIGIGAEKTPTASSSIQFAKGATEAMKKCFTPDNDSYYVSYKNDGELHLEVKVSDLYYKGGTFYTDSACTSSTSMTKISEAVKCLNSTGKIHMLSQYAFSASETVDVPANANITVIRESSFADASMFKIIGVTFTVNAEDPTSSITFDGQKIVTSSEMGGAFFANNGSIQLNGTNKSGGGKTITIQNNNIQPPSSSYVSHGGGMCLYRGTNTLKHCNIINNSTTGDDSKGGGVYIYSGTSTLQNCNIANNSTTTNNSSGGGVYIESGTTITIESCDITNNASSCGGAIYSLYAKSATLSNCNITGNTVSSTTSQYAYGGGIYFYGGTNKLFGTMNITGNTSQALSGSSNSNLSFARDSKVILSENGNELSTNSKFGVGTYISPTADTPVTFATGATEAMKACFTPDNSDCYVDYKDSELRLCLGYSDLYYKDGTFYSNSTCTSSTSMTKISEAVKCLNSTGKIHMLSQYASLTNETVDVPTGKNITVIRESSFTNASMFRIDTGTFIVNAEDPTSSITFDGNKTNAAPTSSYSGGLFYLASTSKVLLNGTNKNGGGKTITLQNSKIGNAGSCRGAAICIYGGQHRFTNCAMLDNYTVGVGGAISADYGTTVVKDCTLTGNGSAIGSGIYVDYGSVTLLGTMNITGNTASNPGKGLRLGYKKTVALSNGSESLSTSSQIDVETYDPPTADAPVTFATGATSAMASCFTPDNSSSYKVTYSNSELSLAVK